MRIVFKFLSKKIVKYKFVVDLCNQNKLNSNLCFIDTRKKIKTNGNKLTSTKGKTGQMNDENGGLGFTKMV